MRTLVILIALVVFASLTAGDAFAVELRGGGSVFVSKSKPIADDLAAAGNQVAVEPEVRGDVLAAGHSVAVSGPVEDSVMLAGYSVALTGKAGNDAFMFGRYITVNAPVADNAYLCGEAIVLGKDASVGVDVLAQADEVVVAGKIGRNLRIGAEYVTIGGEVGGNVYADLCGGIRLTKNAVIKGDLYYESPSKILIDGGAKVLGKIRHRLPLKEKLHLRLFNGFAWQFGLLIAGIIFGAVAITIFPERSQSAADTVRGSFWRSAGIGFVALIAVPIACVLGLITVVGIPLALAVVAVYAILIYASRIFAALALGQWILGRGRETKPKPVGSMILGLVALAIGLPIIDLIPGIGGFAGSLIGFFVLISGFGGVLVSWWRDRGLQTEGSISV